MDSFLEFLETNYTYFLIAAGVLILALIGLIVSGKKKKKEGNVDFEETPVDNTVTVNESTPVAEPTAPVNEPVAPVAPATPSPTITEPVTPEPTVSAPAPETINLSTPVAEPTAPVNNTIDFNNNVSIPPSEPVNTPDEPIVQINPTENNTFEIDQNNSNSGSTL